MNFVEFLTTLENTLDEISVCGKGNVDRMNACFIAINEMRNSILQMAQKRNAEATVVQKLKEEETPVDTPTEDGGETDG